ncbi:MAG TPA: hypothetical protein DDW81_00600 [Cryomorphaceae bacterium]|nr:hypothetical protein [Owenweeksia sp.]HBF18560.1 hypothetical protein [Cryomorphaceae bacterium]|tara:strand:- start:306 stop:2192 length:1887 start_codon:yes stop_codon:yes gene_type:complete
MIRKSIISLFLTGLVLIVFYRGALMTEFEDTQVDPDFAQRASVADNIEVEFLSAPLPTGENVIYHVEINDPNVTKPFHAIMVEGQKVVLRDDGKEADAVAGDKIYSVYATEDIGQFSEEMRQRQDLIVSGQVPVFKGRSMVDVSSPIVQDIANQDFSRITPGSTVNLPLAMLGPVAATANGKNKVASVPVLVDHSLFITDPKVIEDPKRTYDPCTGGNPNGPHTFWEISRQMASLNPGSIATDIQTSDFLRKWLDSWFFDITENSDLVKKRPLVANIIQSWEAFPGGPLDPKQTPFKLIAIVNRMDLRGNTGYSLTDAGEIRFVFQLIDNQGCFPHRFLAIFEYGINMPKCDQLHNYALKWADLSTLPIGDPSYNSLLEDLTNQVTLCGKNPSKPNENCINQVRTNEITLDNGDGWRLNEFHLTATGNPLTTATVVRNPEISYNTHVLPPGSFDPFKVSMLAAFANANQAQIIDDTYDIPLIHPISGAPFLGAKSITGGNANHFWDAGPVGSGNEIVNDTCRHLLSLNTCGGCHGGESRQGGPLAFTHLELNGMFPASVQLSQFLTGGSVPDPAGRPVTWNFNDLLRRQLDFQDFVDNGCTKKPKSAVAIRPGSIATALAASPMRMSH